MTTFRLTIVTPAGSKYDGTAERLTVRTTEGAVSILPRHINYVAAIGIGPAEVVIEGNVRGAACNGGMLAVTNGEVRLIASSFLWKDEIDTERAKKALEHALEQLSRDNLSNEERTAFQAALKRAETRLRVAGK